MIHALSKSFSAAAPTPARSAHQPLLEEVDLPQDSVGSALEEPLHFKLGNGHEVSGHLARDEHHAEYAGSQYPLRTYMLTDKNEVAAVAFEEVFRELSAPPYPAQRYKISQKQLDKVLDRSDKDRDRRLNSLDHLEKGLRATPKDNSLNPTTVTMFTDTLDDVSGVYADQMAMIGQVEGFHVRLATPTDMVKDLQSELKEGGIENVSVVGIPVGEVWMEDYGEPMLEKGWIAPAMFEGDWLAGAIEADRERRLPGVDISFSQQGQVHASQLQPAALATAAATGGEARQALSYLEGGNIMTGTRQDGTPYALIGRDSVALTRELLSRQTGSEIPEARALEVIAADLGVEPAQVFPVEQPGEFHVDMRMMPIAPGEVAINDAKAAAEQQIQWLKADLDRDLADGLSGEDQLKADFEDRCTALREEAEKRAVYEKLTIRDLKAAGIKVHRLPGVFVNPDNPTEDTANFFNARHGVNEQGERFSVFMGGTPEEEALVAEKILKETGAKITRLHFLDPTQTAETLGLWGGLKCRSKPDGQVVSADLLQSPAEGRLSA